VLGWEGLTRRRRAKKKINLVNAKGAGRRHEALEDKNKKINHEGGKGRSQILGKQSWKLATRICVEKQKSTR